MKGVRVTVADRDYYLPAPHSIDALKAALLAAVHAGGAYVDIPSGDGLARSVLVSPGLAVLIEEFDIPEADPDYEGEWPRFAEYI
jgi:hypothetical protein